MAEVGKTPEEGEQEPQSPDVPIEVLIPELYPESNEGISQALPRIKGIDTTELPEGLLAEANRRFDAIEPILQGDKNYGIGEAAANLGMSTRTIQRLISKFHESNSNILSLAPYAELDRYGRRLDPRSEVVIEETLAELWDDEQQRFLREVIYEIRQRCRERGFPEPSHATVYRRVQARSPYEVAKARFGEKVAETQFGCLDGIANLGSTILQEWELDSTPANYRHLNPERTFTLPRAHLTGIFDVYSRICMAAFLSPSEPGLWETGEAIFRAVMPKTSILEEGELDWPCYGLPQVIVTDSAQAYRCIGLRSGLAFSGVSLKHRTLGKPQTGPFGERAFLEFSRMFNSLPGTTFSNVQQRGRYDSDKFACLTFAELEELVDRFARFYNYRRSEVDGKSPVERWMEGLHGGPTTPGIGEPRMPQDPRQFRISLLPWVTRTIQREGISLDNLYYQHRELGPLIGMRDPTRTVLPMKFKVRYDEHDRSKVYLYLPRQHCHLEVPLRTTVEGPITGKDVRMANRLIRERLNCKGNEELIARELRRLRALVEAGQQKTKLARRKGRKGRTEPSLVQTPTNQAGVQVPALGCSETAVEVSECVTEEVSKEPLPTIHSFDFILEDDD